MKEITNNDNKSTSINEINLDGKVVSDEKGISDALNDHFVSIGNKFAGEILDPVKASIDYLSKTGKIDTRFSFKRIHPKQVFDILSKLKNGKAMGQNMIPNQILKSSKIIISQSLADIFNASLKSSIFPDDLQSEAARVIANVIYENTDHAKLLKDLDWLNVRELNEFDTASLMYKIENDLAPTHMKEMFVKTSDLHTYSTRSATSGSFHPPHRKLNIGKASFSYRVHMYGINCLLKSGGLSLLKTFIRV